MINKVFHDGWWDVGQPVWLHIRLQTLKKGAFSYNVIREALIDAVKQQLPGENK